MTARNKLLMIGLAALLLAGRGTLAEDAAKAPGAAPVGAPPQAAGKAPGKAQPPDSGLEVIDPVRQYAHCIALAEVNLELHSVKMAAPAPGFASRFQVRLEAQRVRERRNRLVGAFILTAVGAGLSVWYATPYVIQFIGSPAAWIAAAIHFCLTLLDMARAIGEIGSILLRVLPDFIPPFGWMVILSTLSGFALLWVVSIWRFTRFAKGV